MESFHSCSVSAPESILGFTPVLCLSPPKPKKRGTGPAAMQGVKECALLSVKQRCIQIPAKTGTFFSFLNSREAPFQKKYPVSVSGVVNLFFFFPPSPFYGLLISIFHIQSSKDIFWAQSTHVILPLTAVQMSVHLTTHTRSRWWLPNPSQPFLLLPGPQRVKTKPQQTASTGKKHEFLRLPQHHPHPSSITGKTLQHHDAG